MIFLIFFFNIRSTDFEKNKQMTEKHAIGIMFPCIMGKPWVTLSLVQMAM